MRVLGKAERIGKTLKLPDSFPEAMGEEFEVIEVDATIILKAVPDREGEERARLVSALTEESIREHEETLKKLAR